MKRKLLMCVFCLMGLCTWAEVTDHIEISAEDDLNPGGDEVCLTFSLVGSTNYTAYWFDVYLPEGITANYFEGALDINISQDDETFYPKTTNGRKKEYTHSLTCSYGVVGERVLRVSCNSSVNAQFNSNSGELFTFYVKASSYCKPGERTIEIKGFGLKEAAGIPAVYPDDHIATINVSTSATASVNISAANKWSTCVLPFDAALPEGVNAYTCNDKDAEAGVLKLTSASSFEAYTPYILYSEGGFSGTLSGTVDAAQYPEDGVVSSGFLNGAITAQQITSGYVLQKLNDEVKFYNCNGNEFTIPAGKCWVDIPTQAKAFDFEIVDAVTNISNTLININTTNQVYTLSGQKVATMKKGGVYIQQGKKIIKL